MVRSDPPSPKRQKTEEETTCYDGRPEDFDSDECTDEEMQLFDQELDRIGGGFEIDFKKFRYCFGWRPLDLDDSTMVDEPETNRDFIATLVNMALTKHNEERGASLELGKVLIANFHPSCAVTFYISFQVNDPSDGNQTKPYRAVVRYFPGDIEEKIYNTGRFFTAITWVRRMKDQAYKLRSIFSSRLSHVLVISNVLDIEVS